MTKATPSEQVLMYPCNGTAFELSMPLNYTCQHAKKAMSNSLGLIDFRIGLVNFVLNLPNGQVKFFGGIQITEELRSIILIKIFSC